MSNKIFTIRFVNCKNCFCYLSQENANFLDPQSTLKFNHHDRSIHVSARTLNSLHENELGISPLYAKILGLHEFLNVDVTTIKKPPDIKSLTISTLTVDDYEILETLASEVENNLLNQITVVNVQQKFVIRISTFMHLDVIVDNIQPASPGCLSNFTELIVVKPQIRTQESYQEKKWGIFDIFTRTKHEQNALGNILNESEIPSVFTLQSIENLKPNVSMKLHQFTVLVTKEFAPKNTLHKLKFLRNSLEETAFESIIVNLQVIDETGLQVIAPTLYAHTDLISNLNLTLNRKCILEKCSSVNSAIKKVTICPVNNPIEKVIEKFKSYLIEYQQENLVLNSNFPIKITNDSYCLLKFLPEDIKYCVIDSNFLKNCKLVEGETETVTKKKRKVLTPLKFCTNLECIASIVEQIKFLIQPKIACTIGKIENFLLIGKSGSGKSSLLEILNQNVFHPNFYVEIIKCKSLKGKLVDSLHKFLTTILVKLIYFQPSVLMLDDLDVICEKVNEGDGITQEGVQFNRISEMLVGLIGTNLLNNNVIIIATSKSTSGLNENIMQSRGFHLFKNTFVIEDLTKTDRMTLLKYLFEQRPEFKSSFDHISTRTEGFAIQDLVDFTDRAYFESVKEGEHCYIDETHCEIALSKTTTLSLKDVTLHPPGDKDFSDIGGLQEAKNVMLESLTWPLLYPNIFQNAPLRLQSGLLLYGHPGTGKTALVAAAAKQFNLRLISVKGPELLSKYIGASEQAVRNVFEKAQNAKPSILFFDEFDSLAPRRGHDSTGVTDRVVNQLLTQLDGIESLTGVCVLAASSRPDLLDPALLRPGRIDRQILCPLPDEGSRLEILKCLSKGLSFSEDVNLGKLSQKTDGYSGADLQAILYSAQLLAAENLLDNEQIGDDIEIYHRHVQEALETTRPSLTGDERIKYDRIYEKFRHGDVLDVSMAKQRATLA